MTEYTKLQKKYGESMTAQDAEHEIGGGKACLIHGYCRGRVSTKDAAVMIEKQRPGFKALKNFFAIDYGDDAEAFIFEHLDRLPRDAAGDIDGGKAVLYFAKVLK